MDPITILFFALASVIGMDDYSIVSRKVIVTLNPVEKTLIIDQEDLFTIMMHPEDSLTAEQELQHILKFSTRKDAANSGSLIVDQILFSENKQVLNAIVKCSYSDLKDLAGSGIDVEDSGAKYFSLMNIPEWNMRLSDGVLEDNYWIWPADKTVTIAMEPFENMPAEYIEKRASLLPYWRHSIEKAKK